MTPKLCDHDLTNLAHSAPAPQSRETLTTGSAAMAASCSGARAARTDGERLTNL